MQEKMNPNNELKGALEKCEGIEASLTKEQKMLADSATELNSLQRTMDISDTVQLQRMTILLTIEAVGGPRRTYRHQDLEAAGQEIRKEEGREGFEPGRRAQHHYGGERATCPANGYPRC